MSQTQSPRVQIPVGADYHGLSIDGEFIYAYPDSHQHPGDENLNGGRDYLPERANDAYWAHYGTDNRGHVYQCQECGYLTMSKNAKTTAYNKYECPNCEDEGRPGTTAWRRVYPRDSLKTVPDEHKDEVFVDVLALDPDDVPNHKSHLGRIQSQLDGYVSRDELFEVVADAIADARDQGHIDY